MESYSFGKLTVPHQSMGGPSCDFTHPPQPLCPLGKLYEWERPSASHALITTSLDSGVFEKDASKLFRDELLALPKLRESMGPVDQMVQRWRYTQLQEGESLETHLDGCVFDALLLS
jgi:hypothetical protein